jgi:SAM-dependent methyltransferase
VSQPNAYDDLPYPSLPTWYAHPAVMAQRALLLGLEPARLEGCRVLELGAGPGGNLVPMAEQLPGARWLGVDLSAVHVRAGRALCEELGLTNVEMRHASILDIDRDEGPFDYIICHGVYSWVPSPVRERILWLCRELLSEGGLACVSYNCLPGWFLQGMLRTLMLREGGGGDDAEARLDRALDAMRSLSRDLEAVETARAEHLRKEIATFDQHDRSYLFHEYLEADNEPLYLYQFIERAERHGLGYLGDLTPSGAGELPGAPPSSGEPEAVAAWLARLQRQDILGDRRFRAALLARSDGGGRRASVPLAVLRLFATCPVRALTVDMEPGRPLWVSRGNGPTHALSAPLERAFGTLSGAWPRAVPVAELWERAAGGEAAGEAPAAGGDGPGGDSGPAALAAELLDLYQAGIIGLHAARPRVVGAAAARPRLRPLNRIEARRGRALTSAWHHRVNIAEQERLMVPWLDGRPRDEVAARIAGALRSGELPLGQGDPADLAPRIAEIVLAGMAECGLLIEPGPEGLGLEGWR